MESLATLSLDHNQIRDISALATLTGLSTLRLSDNQISDVSSLARLSEFALEKLDLRDNRIQDVTSLARFHISGRVIAKRQSNSKYVSSGCTH